MAGAASTLQEHGPSLDDTTRFKLAQSIETKAHEMSDLISNVLDLMRFESGSPALRCAWETVDDLLAVAQQRCEERVAHHVIEANLSHDLPPVFVDANLVVQVFANLIENLVKYTPAGTRAAMTAMPDGQFLRVTMDDNGPGLPSGDPAKTVR